MWHYNQCRAKLVVIELHEADSILDRLVIQHLQQISYCRVTRTVTIAIWPGHRLLSTMGKLFSSERMSGAGSVLPF